MWPFRPPPPAPPDPMALVALRTQPAMLNPGAQDQIDLAWYRLEAVIRHIEQAGPHPDHAGQHMPEATRHVLYLNGVIAAAAAVAQDEMRPRLRALVERLKAIGWDPAQHLEA